MAAVGTSPPPTAASPGLESQAVPFHGSRRMSDAVARKPLIVPSGLLHGTPRLRDAPVSPVRVNFQQENWAQPSNANIEHYASQVDLVHRLRNPESQRHPAAATYTGPSPDVAQQHRVQTPSNAEPSAVRSSPRTPTSPTVKSGHAAFHPASYSPTRQNTGLYDHSAMTPKDRVLNQDTFRNSRESDETTSTSQQPASIESSAPTDASSLSGPAENSDCAESSHEFLNDDSLSRDQVVPQFQYHHQQDYPSRVASVPIENIRAVSNPDMLDGASNIRRHLTPNNHSTDSFRKSSLPRPHSSYSVYSEFSPRGRSPGLMPGGSHMRAPSAQSRKSPDVRPSSYAELLNVPYPQQAPAPLVLDNSDLRNVIGNNASLLSAQKTLDMYRLNVKKTNDFSIQYSFAVFLISTAQEQGLDFTELKGSKTRPKDADGTNTEATVTKPIELVREARQILQRLANAGYPFAQYYLADGYASGLFNKGKGDHNSAFPLFVLAAKHGHAESGYRAALCYEFGWGCRKDPAKAVQFLRAAAAKRHPGAMTRLGKACLSGDLGEKRYKEGIKWMKLASEAADIQYNAAPYQLGCLYETGYGEDIFQDLNYAAELFTQAAELGHPEANFRMGDAYEHGHLNCPRDPALSVHFYTGAAERGHAAAMMGLCAWYMVGAAPILEKDEEEAYEWARRSAELGFVKAQYAVAYFTEMGIGCRRDILEANLWYVRAADAGDERAKQRLAIIQAAVSGEGTPMDTAAPRDAKMQKGQNNEKDCIVM
ncbi:hypothetical protein S40285_00788 [Stachybotrys chlorohalonatus IBT 40285]|uniref:Protein SKT5 n=1 Tax=Stachybotrys chlorohalonatus (strain IBT 40285) TaxID=1283841 RepID=A0A084QJP1_STAC4|nr:hypothetical protein S40285_00788 [Stachybotrys chlorohalonata IBT 40285]